MIKNKSTNYSIFRTSIMTLSGLILLSACAVTPSYEARPLPEINSAWSQEIDQTAEPTELANWWSTLEDPVLIQLIDTALTQNIDLQQASTRVAEARAIRDWVGGRQAPVVDVAGSVNWQRQSENGPLPVGSLPGFDASQTIHDIGFDAAWEIDLFGSKRRALEGATARLQASQIDAQAVRMHIVAEVARAWITAVGHGRELDTQQALVNTLERTHEITQQRYILGDVARSEVDKAQAQWADAHAVLPNIKARQRAAVLSLAVLLAQPPETVLSLMTTETSVIKLKQLPVGERADVLRRRPDVLVAERHLAASVADTGVATAELFPKLMIGASGGFQAVNAADWFDASSRRYSIFPMISWRLFDGGRVRAEIRASEAAEHRAALAYEQTILAALSDAERALSDYQAELTVLSRRETALDAANRNHAHAQARYTGGDIALIDFLMASRQVHEAEMKSVRAHTAAVTKLVALYKALGGGWNESEKPFNSADSSKIQ